MCLSPKLDADGRRRLQLDAACHRSSESVFFELRPGKQHPSSRCRRNRTHILASLDQQAGSHSGTAACWGGGRCETAGKAVQRTSEKGKISFGDNQMTAAIYFGKGK